MYMQLFIRCYVQDIMYRILCTGYYVQSFMYWILYTEFDVQDIMYRISIGMNPVSPASGVPSPY